MKKYLGSTITAFGAFMAPIFVLFPIFFLIVILSAEVSGATIFLAFGCMICSFLWSRYVAQISNQLYSWGYFRSENILVRSLFAKETTISYAKCNGCGIGFYTHGILNSRVGSKFYFIFFSYDSFDETYRSRINQWKPSETRVKVQFSQKLYDYLIKTLPPKQAHKLQRDFQKYMS